MNLETKLVFALEHVAHLEDLIEGNEYEQYLSQSLSTMKYEFERQLSNEQFRKNETNTRSD
tara:strand:+ start:384 stop:566 length:183 start_codon:yes stop_codon:yes gene_type:complete